MIDRIRHLVTLLRGDTPPPPTVQEFSGAAAYQSEALTVRLRRPIVAGSLILLVFVLGLFLWAAFSPINGAVVSPGTVKVEGYSKEVRHLDAGVIRRIYVHEGQHVAKGQLLVRFDDVAVAANAQVYQSALDSARAQIARYQAQSTNAAAIDFPADLLQRSGDPAIAALLQGQRATFLSTMMLYRTQADVLKNQSMQIENQIAGMQAQIAATEGSQELIQEELKGVQALNKEGYAPRTRLLALQRSAVGLKGQRGQQITDIARAREAVGQLRIQLAQLDSKRVSEAADGLRIAQGQATELEPKLHAAREALEQIEMRAPVDGYVFNLTQRTEGSAAGVGELLMNIVPSKSQLAIAVRVKPQDIAEVKVGMKARVTLTAFNPRTTPTVEGRVELVAADATDDPALRETYYQVRVVVPPSELAKAGPHIKLTPGMPAMVAIATSPRTILGYLLGPMTESMHGALRER